MTKNEWLNILREALRADLPQNEIDNNIAYYRDYIERESSSKPESEVLELLGDPRLIAKTIIDTYQLQRGASGYNAYDNNVQYDYSDIYEQHRSSQSTTVDEEGNVETGSSYYYQVSGIKWYHKAIFFAIIAVVIILLVIIGGVILKLFFTIGLPVLLIVFIYQMFRKR